MLAAIACAASLATIFVIAYCVPAGKSADADIVSTLTRLAGSWIGSLASVVGHSAVVLIPLTLCAIIGWGISAGRRREAIAAGLLVVVAMAGAEILKLALNQPRLRTALGLQEAGAHHFPSGHATASTALAFAALLVVRPPRRGFVLIAGGAYAASVCLSILILGWHLPSDVVGGVLVASLCFCGAVAVLRSLDRRDEPLAGGSPAQE
jgi:membrane-associated phospholipid phosphatase